jgi:hypothetical protein
MQLEFNFIEKPKASLLDLFGPLLIVAILLLAIFVNRSKTPVRESSKPDSRSSGTIKSEVPTLTLTQLRKHKGYENISDEEGKKVLETSSRLSRLMCEFIKNNYNHEA